jgi:hypothetical protein
MNFLSNVGTPSCAAFALSAAGAIVTRNAQTGTLVLLGVGAFSGSTMIQTANRDVGGIYAGAVGQIASPFTHPSLGATWNALGYAGGGMAVTLAGVACVQVPSIDASDQYMRLGNFAKILPLFSTALWAIGAVVLGQPLIQWALLGAAFGGTSSILLYVAYRFGASRGEW